MIHREMTAVMALRNKGLLRIHRKKAVIARGTVVPVVTSLRQRQRKRKRRKRRPMIHREMKAAMAKRNKGLLRIHRKKAVIARGTVVPVVTSLRQRQRKRKRRKRRPMIHREMK